MPRQIEQAAAADSRISVLLEGKTGSKGRGRAGQAGQFRRGIEVGSDRARVAEKNGLEGAGMSRSHYLVGIDLGTTNCAVAYVDTHGRERPTADIRNFPVPQLVAPGETAPRPMLPSFLYLPGEHELPPGAARLPWSEAPGPIVGEFARFQGAKVPARSVSSAKSWLCHPGNRPRGRDPALGQPTRGHEGLAGRGLGGVSAAHSRCMERHSLQR